MTADRNSPRSHLVEDQGEVLRAMAGHAIYGGRLGENDAIEQIHTHGAVVFLAGDDAYKIKRAVKYPFMDFSTLARREAVCRRELEINARTAPQIYLDVIAITRESDGTLRLGGDGAPVEWAVHMRRFAQRDILSEIAAAGAIPEEMVRDLADHIVRFHAEAPPAPDIDGPAIIDRVIAQTCEAFGEAARLLADDAPARYEAAVRAALAGNGDLLRARAGAGFVRRCHGDLHLKNIVLIDGRPVLFDAIEFDEAIATIDVLYDIAFLIMDLCDRDLHREANLVLNRYLWQSREPAHLDALAALPLFLGCRAAIRAMVTFYQMAFVRGAAAAASVADARRYFDAALSFLAPPGPRLIAIGGLSGTGKSTLAAGLAPSVPPVPGAVHLRSDLERKALFGVEETKRLGPDAYEREVTDKVYDAIAEKARRVLAAGHSVIADAVYATEAERSALEAVAGDAGVPFQGLWLEAPARTLKARVKARRGDASDATVEVVEKQTGYDLGAITWTRLDASGTCEAVLERAEAVIA